MDNIEIFGYSFNPNLTTFQLNGEPVTIDTNLTTYNQTTQVFNINKNSLLDLNTDGPIWLLTWENNGTTTSSAHNSASIRNLDNNYQKIVFLLIFLFMILFY